MTNLLKNGYTVDLVDDGEITLAYVFRANGTYASPRTRSTRTKWRGSSV